jgi:hypothetical protein
MSEISPGADSLVRYFVLTVGRSGSSLLAATLADAGADFGVEVPRGWDPRTGQMEGREIKIAAHHYRRAYDISIGRKYAFSPALEAKFRIHRARRHLKRALTQGRFLKIGDLDLVVQPSFKLGYSPRVILNYRQLELNLPSLLVGRTNVGPDQLAEEYVRIYRQGLSLLKTFGGCAVAYNELQDRERSGWAHALASLTHLDLEKLIASRNVRLKGAVDPDDVRPIYPLAYALYEEMRALEGVAIPPSRQVLRTLNNAAN